MERVSLENVCLKITDGSHFSPKGVQNGIPYITVRDIKNDSIDFNNCLRIAKTDYDQLVQNDCRPLVNDLLFSKDGTVGKVALINYNVDFVVLSSLAIIRPDLKKINPKYLFYVLKSSEFLGQALAHKKGVAIRRIILRDLKEIKFNLFEIEIQNKIVQKIEELISELDIGIENLKLGLQQLKTYRQSVLKWAFEGKLTKEWRSKTILNQVDNLIADIRRKRKSSAIKTKYGDFTENANDRLILIPKEWRWIRNEELLYYVTSGSRDWKKYYSKTGSYFIRTQNLNTNSLIISDIAYVNLPKNVEGKRSLVETGDLLMTITGANVGKVALVEYEIPEAYVSQSVALMKYIDKRMGKYLWYYFQCKDFGQGLINGLVYGMGRPVLSLENMKEVPIALCSLEEQAEIVLQIENKLSAADKLEESIVQSINQSEILRQSILKKAFEGKLN